MRALVRGLPAELAPPRRDDGRARRVGRSLDHSPLGDQDVAGARGGLLSAQVPRRVSRPSSKRSIARGRSMWKPRAARSADCRCPHHYSNDCAKVRASRSSPAPRRGWPICCATTRISPTTRKRLRARSACCTDFNRMRRSRAGRRGRARRRAAVRRADDDALRPVVRTVPAWQLRRPARCVARDGGYARGTGPGRSGDPHSGSFGTVAIKGRLTGTTTRSA